MKTMKTIELEFKKDIEVKISAKAFLGQYKLDIERKLRDLNLEVAKDTNVVTTLKELSQEDRNKCYIKIGKNVCAIQEHNDELIRVRVQIEDIWRTIRLTSTALKNIRTAISNAELRGEIVE